MTQKQKLIADQLAKREKEKLLAEPIERAKAWLKQIPVHLRDLQMAMNDMKSAPVRRAVPARFLKEYTGAVEAHIETLSEQRTHLEGIMCKDKRTFARKAEGLDKAEKELEEVSKTLRAWKHSLHVYCNTSKDKGKDKGMEAEGNDKKKIGGSGSSGAGADTGGGGAVKAKKIGGSGSSGAGADKRK